MTDPLVSIILPVYNQADHIADVVRQHEEILSRLPARHETLLVVNGSRDASLKVCQALVNVYPAVRVIESARRGWGVAVKLGLSEARGEVLCFTNSARTSPQDLLLLLLYAVTYPNVVVTANRKNRPGWQRKLGTLLYTFECRFLFNLSTWDINGTPKVFPRRFDELLSLKCEDYLIDLEFMAVCRREGYPIIEVPIFASNRRYGGKSTTTLRVALKLYWDPYRFRRKFAPPPMATPSAEKQEVLQARVLTTRSSCDR
jgi:glycosyltransferase involved in cell wall biosynthesis